MKNNKRRRIPNEYYPDQDIRDICNSFVTDNGIRMVDKIKIKRSSGNYGAHIEIDLEVSQRTFTIYIHINHRGGESMNNMKFHHMDFRMSPDCSIPKLKKNPPQGDRDSIQRIRLREKDGFTYEKRKKIGIDYRF